MRVVRQLRTAPGAREQPLRTRVPGSDREVLRPEWDAHVGQWLPEPLSAPDPTEDTPPPRRSRREHLSVHGRRPSKRAKPVEPTAARKPRPSSSRTRRCPSPTPELV
ncbi:hypothetical protein Ae717Ps2_7369 [Pseudonocardia sp. Ae717_Ps2]|nr:hypothetical protein Ae717Ps2_7369 [Pseudonocardia sp. Ae717_Ps2]